MTVFAARADPLSQALLANRRACVVAGWTLPLPRPEDVILRHLEVYRRNERRLPSPWRDAVWMLKARAVELDWADLRERAESLGLSELLTEAIAAS